MHFLVHFMLLPVTLTESGHFCEILETTENLNEKLLAGGGFYPPEGIPHPKHVTSRGSAWGMPKPAYEFIIIIINSS
jgi:hypothetical protein